MPSERSYVTRTYNLSFNTDERLKAISRQNHELPFGKVIDWAVEALFEKLFGVSDPQPISEREELDRR